MQITSPCEVSGFNVPGASTNGVHVTDACLDVADVYDFYVHGCGKDNITDNILIHGVARLTDFESTYAGVKNVLASGLSASCACIRGIATHGWSGGFYAFAGATMRCDFCIARDNGREEHDDDSGFNAHDGAANNLTLYHCTSAGNYGRGISLSVLLS